MKHVTIINRLEIKPGSTDAFIDAQRAFATGLMKTHGYVVGGRMYRSLDSKSVVLVSVFDSMEAQEQARKLDAFKEHLARIQPMTESSSPALYDIAYSYGDYR
jgi:quinol monooxygenase YgiN